MPDSQPIGVFDSGLGGLTVAHAIREALPNEAIIYLGDTARVPYGTRSAATVIRYARACAKHLRERNVKVLVVACNTVSAVALDMLRVELDIPVLGVIEPGARAGVAASRSHRVGVIATAGTINSGAYKRAIAAVESRTEVVAYTAPLLVPLVEEGWLNGEVPHLVVRKYLEPLSRERIDALILGCTHYPLLKSVIRDELRALSPAPVAIIDSAEATASELAQLLRDRNLLTEQASRGALQLLVTDLPGRFAEVASRFLSEDVTQLDVRQIDL